MRVEILKNNLMRYGSKIGLKANQKDIIWHLLDHDFNGKGYVWPSLVRIAALTDYEDEKSVSRIIKSVEKLGLIEVLRNHGKSNRYSFEGLIKRLQPFYNHEVTGVFSENGEQDNTGQNGGDTPPKMEGSPPPKLPPEALIKNSRKELKEYSTVNQFSGENENSEKYKQPKKKDSFFSQRTEIIAYLNAKTLKRYKPDSSKAKTTINARLNDGYTVKDFEEVIDKKWSEWERTEFEKFMRPETLFGSKFDGYLNQPAKAYTKPNNQKLVRAPSGANYEKGVVRF